MVNSFSALTKTEPTILREIITEAGVSIPIPGTVTKDDKRILQTTALWDTGASNCVITKKTATALKLIPTSMTQVRHAGGISYEKVYLVNIYLPNDVAFPGVRVTECDDAAGDFGIIIGMDVITKGDFSLTNVGGKSTFSFRIPSVSTIDYVQDAKTLRAQQFKHVMPNDSCPCGSGKKFKHCHKNKI